MDPYKGEMRAGEGESEKVCQQQQRWEWRGHRSKQAGGLDRLEKARDAFSPGNASRNTALLTPSFTVLEDF